MLDGFIKIAAATPEIRVADTDFNAKNIIAEARRLSAEGAKVIAFPELCISGCTCGDLFLQSTLLNGCENALEYILKETAELDAIIAVGLPVESRGKLCNCAAIFSRGELLGLVPKTNISNRSERCFTSGKGIDEIKSFAGQSFWFGAKQLFRCEDMPELVIGVEIGDDLRLPIPPSTELSAEGATLIINLGGANELVARQAYRRTLIGSTSARLSCAYLYAEAGEGESTTDLVFCGRSMIAENGKILAEASLAENEAVTATVDLSKLISERRRTGTFAADNTHRSVFSQSAFSLIPCESELPKVNPAPFIPSDKAILADRCEEILTIQALGLKKRLKHTGCSGAVLGLSGGLDSTLAYLVTVRAFDMLGLDRKGILAVTMPCFGTTKRTYDNALTLSRELGTDFREVSIKNAVRVHFSDIGQSEDCHDVTFENAQARERTQVLMDIANQTNALVIGTGDLSELAMGWATYNGDHMSMYGVNGSIPKTLVRHLVAHVAEQSAPGLKACLLDILATPVSPELLPPKDGVISQQTEDIIGPYELHDFFLYQLIRFGFSPKKIFRLAEKAFDGRYDRATIKKWLGLFLRRFFAAQFKRSCMPDGPKVGSVGLSPRGDWNMPSDASRELWLREVEEIQL